MQYELFRRRHRAVLLTMTVAATSPASRLGPLAPATAAIFSNAETPGALAVGDVTIASDAAAVVGVALESRIESASHSLSASATRIEMGAPPADSCCDFTLIDS